MLPIQHFSSELICQAHTLLSTDCPCLYLGPVNGPIPKAKSPFPNGKSKLFFPVLMKVKAENKGQKSAVLYRELCVLLLSVVVRAL